MNAPNSGTLARVFRFIIAKRWWVVAIYLALIPVAVRYALSIEQDDAVERLIVHSDPEWVTAQEFEKVFGGGEFVMVLAEADPPFSSAVLHKIDAIERELDALDHVDASSAISIYRRVRGGFGDSEADAEGLRQFLAGTRLFARQGIAGERFIAIPLALDVRGAAARNEVLARVDHVLAKYERSPSPLQAVRKVGGPYVDRFLEHETSNSVRRYFPLFGVLLIGLNLFLYRSFRALLAFGITTVAALALTVGAVGATGGVLTIVSSLVPMTILITCTATLVYIHSRFVEQPDGASIEDHQIFALTNKFLPCTASVFATMAGFAALSVSRIRPIRDLGIWTAGGLAITWVVAFTLFPALQRILRTPSQQQRKLAAGAGSERLAAALPLWTYRYRWLLVPGALVLCAAGAVALFGFPGVLEPMHLETGGLEYIDPKSDVYRDTKRLEQLIGGLTVTEVWLRGEPGRITDPEVLLGMEKFARALEADPRVGAVIGPTTVLRILRYVGGEGDGFPDDPAGLDRMAANLESLLSTEPAVGAFVDARTLSQARLTVRTRRDAFTDFAELDRTIRARWEAVCAEVPAVAALRLATTGHGPLEAKMSANLVPTLTESFAITAAIIFLTFLVVFRSGAARLMAMIPSLFAILVMFGLMRIFGVGLNVATILIATTVLGASENDQIHFFHHYLEGSRGRGTEGGLRHALLVAGRAIVFATLINAGGFMAFALSDLPPMRHFGAFSALAFVLSMIADFTALPAALWIVFRDKPDSYKTREGRAA